MIRTSIAVSSVLAACLLWAGGAARADTVPNFGGPGVASPGYPDFLGANAQAKLTENRDGSFTLSVIGSPACGSPRAFGGCGGATLNFPGAAYFVGNESMSITANFSAKGVFTSGTYTLIGSLPAWSNPSTGTAPAGFSWGAQGVETLLTANLTGDTVDAAGEALGFTEVITGGWADQAQFTSGGPESVWLYSLLGGQSIHGDDDDQGNENGNGRFRRKGHSNWDRFLADLQSGHLRPANLRGIGSVATTPLPAAVWLLGSGLVGLFGLARRRRLPASP